MSNTGERAIVTGDHETVFINLAPMYTGRKPEFWHHAVTVEQARTLRDDLTDVLLDDNQREAIGELLSELDELRAGRFVQGHVSDVDKAFLAELAGRASDLIDLLLGNEMPAHLYWPGGTT